MPPYRLLFISPGKPFAVRCTTTFRPSPLARFLCVAPSGKPAYNHPIGWCTDGKMKKQSAVVTPRPAGGESEKITINLGPVDLGQIDLLVEEGFYSNRTDLIRTAIRNQLALHAGVVRETVARRSLVLGLQRFSRQDLEALQAAHERLNIQVLGLATIAADVSPELALATIESVVVLGAFHASPAVKAALAGRIL
jgi:Arc/MetJ-type ribon-helix-helix transcriptional regulator